MTPRQLEILQHALGCDKHGTSDHPHVGGNAPFYRNRFCAGISDEPDCVTLVELGYMVQHQRTEWLPYFNCSVTNAGVKAMIEASPKPVKPTRSQQRYRDFVDFADAFPCSFKEFIQIQNTDWYKRLKSGQPLRSIWDWEEDYGLGGKG